VQRRGGGGKKGQMVQGNLNAKEMEGLLEGLAEQIVRGLPKGPEGRCSVPVALVGIRSRGEILAQRLQAKLENRLGAAVDRGTLDITLYRDDLNQMGYQQPRVRATEIDFDLDDRLVVLVDDVLNTGRSVRAALDALADLGRPRAIRLAVLIDRGQRELPISADYVGQRLDVAADKRVNVYVREVDEREEVAIE